MTATSDDEYAAGSVQIGVLARATGLTVRTLHHYDEIGLLVPDTRSYSGRRLYSERNVTRLYRIVALRQLGLSLDEIAVVLDENPDLAAAIRQHLERVEESLARGRRLKRTLIRMLDVLERVGKPTLEQVTQAIEEMVMLERYFTPEQLERLARRGEEMDEEGRRRVHREWAEVIDMTRAALSAGTAPTDPRMLELARRWLVLFEELTGGDAGIRESFETMYSREGAEAVSGGRLDEQLVQYVSEAVAALMQRRDVSREAT